MAEISERDLDALAGTILRRANTNSRRGWLAQLGLAALVAGGVGSGSGTLVGSLSKAEAQQLAQTEARAEVARSDRIARIEAEVEKQKEADEDQQEQLDCIEEDVRIIDRNLRALMNYQRGRDARAPAPETRETPRRDED